MTTPVGRPTPDELRAGSFLTLDPAVEHPACAIFDGGMLQVAERVKIPHHGELAKLDEGERCRQIAELIEAWVLQRLRQCLSLNAVAFELPQLYGVDKSKGDPNKLVPLAMVGAAVAMALRVRTITYQPREWTMGIPKSTKKGEAWTSPRGKLIARRSSAEERARVEPTHDAVDAFGIGLFALGRLDRVFAGTV